MSLQALVDQRDVLKFMKCYVGAFKGFFTKKFHPYKITVVQKLLPIDPLQRLQLSQHMLELIEDENGIIMIITFCLARHHVSGKAKLPLLGRR